jgi:hypothetical protein
MRPGGRAGSRLGCSKSSSSRSSRNSRTGRGEPEAGEKAKTKRRVEGSYSVRHCGAPRPRPSGGASAGFVPAVIACSRLSAAAIAWSWQAPDGQRRHVAGNQGQCYVRLPFADLAGRRVRLEDLLSSARYEREGSDLVSRGLYLDLPPWGFHAFAMTAA